MKLFFPFPNNRAAVEAWEWLSNIIPHFVRHAITCPWLNLYTLRPKKAAISQTTLSNEFSWMKMFEFRLRFHWSLFLRVQLTNIPAFVQIMAWQRKGSNTLSEPMAIRLPHIYASLRLNELGNIILNFARHVITYPCWDLSLTMTTPTLVTINYKWHSS